MTKEGVFLNINRLPENEREDIQDIISGKKIPPLYADAIAKRIFHPDVHPDRLNFLMRSIAKDDSIDVRSSADNEGFRQSLQSKGMIYDIPSWLKDNRRGDVEVQKIAQDFIFTRTELYTSNMLLLQYSVDDGQPKSKVRYKDVKGALVIVLMVESPEAFTNFDAKSAHYIHRFTKITADTGLTYEARAKAVYVQLDKCLKQYLSGMNAEAKDGKPDILQLWLSMIADVNNEIVAAEAEKSNELKKIRAEAMNMAQDKEVQNMLIQEKLERMDFLSYGDEREEKGEKKGEKRGEDKFARLVSKLIQAGRYAELEKAANDTQCREKLFKEFNIN